MPTGFESREKRTIVSNVWGEFLELEFEGKRIAANHFDNIARPIAASGLYDLVCYGHNHRIRRERTGRTLAINPGAIMGAAFASAGWEPVDSTFAMFDTETGEAEAFRVVDAVRVESRSWPES